MYICQDKCYRLVPEKDHRYAQSKNYLRYARFCGICKVVYQKGTSIHQKILKEDSFLCPCCSAKTRGYFDVEKKRNEWVLQNVLGPIRREHSIVFDSTETFQQIVDRVFKSQDIKDEETTKSKEWKARLKPVAAPPQRAKPTKAMIATKLYKLTMYPIDRKEMEISVFPQQQ